MLIPNQAAIVRSAAHELANLRRRMLARRRHHSDDPPVPFNQSRQEPITRPAGSDEGFIVKDSSEVAFNLQAELKSAQSELTALREENERLKSESFEELYNAVIDERDALREELATVQRGKDNADLALTTQTKNKDRYKQRAFAAEQRNAELERDAARYRWLRNPEQRDCVPPELDVICGVAEGEDVLWFEQLDRTIDAALKPTESGARE